MDLKNKNILVTGADGFIGSHLVEALLEEGCTVKAFTYYNSFNSWGWLDTFHEEKLNEIEVFPGDIRDPNGVRTAVNDADVVFHLAALIGIPFSYHSPDSYVDTNIKGTLNVLHACKDCDIERVIVTSTSEVYGTAKYVPIDEKHPLQGQSPYSASKIGADKIAESFYRSFNTPVVIARPFNTYGPRQSARAVIPTIITQLLNGSRKIELGSLHPTRDLNYEISIGDLGKLIIGLINPDAEIISKDIRKRPKKSEVERLVCDNSLMQELAGWKPQVSLKEGLVKTIEWFKNRENLRKYKWDIYNV